MGPFHCTSEKVDVFSLGNIIYNLLTGHSPRGPTRQDRMQFQANQVKRGIPPILDKIYSTSNQPAVVAMREAVNKCYQPDPQKRSSAREIATGLLKVLNETMK